MKRIIGLFLFLLSILFIMPNQIRSVEAVSIMGNGTGGIYINIDNSVNSHYRSRNISAYGPTTCTWFVVSRTEELTNINIDTVWGPTRMASNYPFNGNGFGYSSNKDALPTSGKAVAIYSNHVRIIEKVEGNNVLISEGGSTYYSDANHGYCVIRWMSKDDVKNKDGGLLGYIYFPNATYNQVPVGSIDSFYVTNTGLLHISGWVFDPDHMDNNEMRLDILLNGNGELLTIVNTRDGIEYRPGVNNNYPYHGFSLDIPLDVRGTHTFGIWGVGFDTDSADDWAKIGEVTAEISADYANTISLNKTQLNLDSGTSETLSVNYFPSDTVNKKARWSSSNTDVATVSNGVITAKAPGKAVITATAYGNDNATATCTVTVTGTPVSSLKFIRNYIEIPIGYEVDGTIYTGEVDVQAKIDPSNASTKNVIWYPHYDKLYVDGGLWWIKPTAKLINADGCQELWQPDGNIFICPDDSYVLKIQGGIYPNAKIGETKQFKISTSKDFDDYSDILTVKLVSAIKSIVITNPSSENITEKTVSVVRGSSLQLSASAEPFYNPQTFTWTSSDPSIATVSSTGKVNYIGSGTVTITATSTDGGGKSEWVKLTDSPSSTCKKPGDLTGDGEITGKDLMRLQRYLVDKNTPLSCSGDVNGDSAVTGKDLMRLQRYLVDKTTILY